MVHNPKWPKIQDNSCRILIVCGMVTKTNKTQIHDVYKDDGDCIAKKDLSFQG